MRILHVVPYCAPAFAYGGIPRAVASLTGALATRGVESVVVATNLVDPESDATAPAVDYVSGAHILRVPVLWRQAERRLGIPVPVGLRRVLGRVGAVDAVHLHGHRHLLNHAAVGFWSQTAAGTRAPIVLSAHGSVLRIEGKHLLKGAYDRFLGDRLLGRVRVFHAVSQAEAKQYEEAGAQGSQIRVVPNVVDPGEFAALPPRGAFRARWGIAADRPVFLFIAKITPRKRLDLMLRAFAALDSNDAVLIVAGNALTNLAPVTQLISQFGIGARVIMTGFLAGADRAAAFVDADLTVYPAEDEIFGLAAFESILCGTPVLASDDCGMGEWVRAVGGGRVFRRGSVVDLKHSLDRFLRGAWGPVREELPAAQAKIKAWFSADAVGAAMCEQVYG